MVMPRRQKQNRQGAPGSPPESERKLDFSARESAGLLTTDDLCAYLQVSKRTVQYWTPLKRIPHLKIGHSIRFRLADVERALMRYAVEEIH
jgi:excisionase family DNA binding protein